MPITIPEVCNCSVIEVTTPDGTMFVTILELNNKPIGFRLEIGKSGSTLRAWCEAVGQLATLAIQAGISLDDIITELSNLSSDKLVFTGKQVPVRSGPDGFVVALMRYRQSKYDEMLGVLGVNNTKRRRPPKLNQSNVDD
jgi:hypothetical protein